MTAPATVHGSLALPQFGPDTVNPFDLITPPIGGPAAPVLVDIDGDGDLDMFITNESGGDVAFFRNVGDATHPSFAAESQSFGIPPSGTYDHLSFFDINGDGLIDALEVDGYGGHLTVGINTGTTADAHFDFSVLAADPYGWSRFGFRSTPTFADINGDSLVDVVLGTYRGGTYVMLNNGTATAPHFDVPDAHPYGLPAHNGYLATPAFADIDGDGDLDAVFGGFAPYAYNGGSIYGSGNLSVAMNTGTATAPSFGPLQTNPFGLTLIYPNNIFAHLNPTFADIDGDGDADLVVGDWYGNVHVFTNESRIVAPVASATANGAYIAGDVITLTVTFSGAVTVDETSGTPTLSLETGATDRDAIYSGGSGTDTLTFSYTVQAGDVSGNLDITSSSALALNGATIRDAGGHNVPLTLGDPGGPGSLASNAALVIDALAPTPTLDSTTLPGSGSAILQSSEPGTAYLVATSVTVTDVASITSASASQWKSVSVDFADSDTPVQVDGLDDGTYKVYAVDAAGNLSAASGGTVTIDSAAPHGTIASTEFGFVLAVNSTTPNGAYGAGSTISLTVTFDQAVLVNGVPTLQLDTGEVATYSAGDGTDTLTFVYTVQPGDNSNDLDVAGAGALALNGGTIRSASGHDAVLAVAEAGDSGSLSTNFDLVIDTAAPDSYVDDTAVPDNSGSVNISSNESGTAYLVSTGVTVTDVASITGAPDSSWNEAALPGTGTMSLAGLDDGTYKLYVVDAAGNVSQASTDSVVIDSTPPVATLTPAVLSHFGSATVQSSEAGEAVLVSATAVVTDVDSITALSPNLWRSVTITDPNTDTSLDTTGLRDGTYKLYTIDESGNISAASTDSVTIDTTSPHGTVRGGGMAFFSSPVSNPFGFAHSLSGSLLQPAFADIDGDGDLDAFIGTPSGYVYAIMNTGTARAPVFTSPAVDLFSVPSPLAHPTFADVDGDGDLDAFVGSAYGGLAYFANTGTSAAADFSTPPDYAAFGLSATGSFANADFADIDGDGDLDAFITTYGVLTYFQNLGDAHNPLFDTPVTDPFGFGLLGPAGSVSLADADGDGDLDAFVGSVYGGTQLYLNTGTSHAPQFNTAPVDFPANLSAGHYLGITFADIDGDGDLDAFEGALFNDGLLFFRNTPTVEPIATTMADGHYAAGSTITVTVQFSEAVIVDTTNGSPTLIFETGAIDEAAQYCGGSGTDTLTFSFTVQAGDSSRDLDAYALSLGNATIRDAAGNDAVLSLAAHNAPGSLSKTHAIVIDTAAPVAILTSAKLNNAASATVKSSEVGTAYLVSTSVAVTDVASITSAADADWNQVSLTAGNTFQSLSLAGLGDGSYKLYTTDAAGNLSAASTGTVLVDSTLPVATVATVSIKSSGSVKVQSSEAGVAYLVLDSLAVTDVASITSQADAQWNTVNVTAAGVPRTMSAAGLADGTYKLYVADATGNLSAASTGTVTIDNLAPSVSTPGQTIRSVGSATVESTETGTAYLVSTGVAVTGLASITSASNASWNKVAVTAGVPAQLSAAGLADGTYVMYAADAAGNLSAASANAVTVDSTAPHVQAVYSNDPAVTYHVGDTVTVNVAFTESVTVVGAPTLLLETGAVDRQATYIGTVGGNVLQFTYTVQAGDFSANLDFTATNSLAFHGATIRDAAGNNAVLALAAPGTTGSLSQSGLHIDGIDDVLVGTPGADRLNGGVGADTMTGGDGSDIYYVDNAGDVVVETNADSLTGGVDTVISTAASYGLSDNVERGIIATNDVADITGNALDNLITAGGGDNAIDGGAGIDTVSYATATAAVSVNLADTGAQATGGSGTDTLTSIENVTGSAYDDVLNGDAGANAINGGAGSDQLYGNGGNDLLTGGTGADQFVFTAASGTDKIRDFSVSEGDLLYVQQNVNGSGIVDGASALAHVHDVSGNAVLDLGGGNTVILLGVHTADLSAASFLVFGAI